MAAETRSAELAASPSQVWAVLSDLGAISGWASNIDDSRLIGDQSEGVGALREVRAGRVTVTERIIVWNPPSELAYEIEGLPLVKSASNTWTLDAHGAGTRVSLTSRVDAGPRPHRRLIARFFARAMAKSAKIMLADLAQPLA